jgi:hypothetical protein
VLRDPERYVVESVWSRTTGEQAVGPTTTRRRRPTCPAIAPLFLVAGGQVRLKQVSGSPAQALLHERQVS